MNQSQAIEVFRGRQTLLNNIEHIMSAAKKSKKSDLSSQGQLDLFGAGLEVEIDYQMKADSGPINVMDWVRTEMYHLGVPVLYSPLDDLEMYQNLYCTHSINDLFHLDKDNDQIVVIDWITDITYHKSAKSGKPYAKIFTNLYGADNFWYLWGKDYVSLIPIVFINETYMFQLNFTMPTPEFSRECINIKYLKNIKDVDVEGEYQRIMNMSKVEVMDIEWIKTNKPEWL